MQPRVNLEINGKRWSTKQTNSDGKQTPSSKNIYNKMRISDDIVKE